jgi:hypothetical protein
MTISITKETGSGDNPAANVYADVADLRAYAELRGVTLPVADDDCAVLLIKAMDYLGKYDDGPRGPFWIGEGKVHADQPLAWPRCDVWRDGALQTNDYMPRELEYATCALAVEANTNDLQPTRLPSDKGPVVTERVEGAITVEYANTGKVLPVAAFAKADALLNTLLRRRGLFAVRA